MAEAPRGRWSHGSAPRAVAWTLLPWLIIGGLGGYAGVCSRGDDTVVGAHRAYGVPAGLAPPDLGRRWWQ